MQARYCNPINQDVEGVACSPLHQSQSMVSVNLEPELVAWSAPKGFAYVRGHDGAFPLMLHASCACISTTKRDVPIDSRRCTTTPSPWARRLACTTNSGKLLGTVHVTDVVCKYTSSDGELDPKSNADVTTTSPSLIAKVLHSVSTVARFQHQGGEGREHKRHTNRTSSN